MKYRQVKVSIKSFKFSFVSLRFVTVRLKILHRELELTKGEFAFLH